MATSWVFFVLRIFPPLPAMLPRRAGLALERERFMDLFDHEDTTEGVNAFLEKRKPEWKNS